jgi:ubiquinone/menaquinone biosynthesis C-methylase UbiE
MVPVRRDATRLLDIAGSHGLFGALIARAHPPMRSQVLDLPQAVEQARKLASAEGLDDVVTFRVGDALVDDLGADCDVVFLGNILHHFTPQQIGDLLARVRRAMSAGGTVAIWEVSQPAADDAQPDLIGDAFALFFRLTSTARFLEGLQPVAALATERDGVGIAGVKAVYQSVSTTTWLDGTIAPASRHRIVYVYRHLMQLLVDLWRQHAKLNGSCSPSDLTFPQSWNFGYTRSQSSIAVREMSSELTPNCGSR